MFVLKNISKKFGEEYALRDVSMNIGSGLNFIVGSSGSGKTTLLNILSGMEQNYEGETFYCTQSVKNITPKMKSYFYHNVFGFVWQDFNLLEDKTVLENIMLPQYLGQELNEKMANRLLRELKINELAHQKVGKLSGGQKQRVAIARELMKSPKVLIADEPTSALDKGSAKTIMEALREISKSRTVIIVTHDTSLIGKSDKVYEFDKGELIASPISPPDKSKQLDDQMPHRFTFSNAVKLAIGNVRSSFSRVCISVFSLLVAATLLLVTMSGAILDSSQEAFDDLFSTYGRSILDINVVGSFIGASGTDNSEKDKPNTDVKQNIGGLYEKYLTDERISHIVFIQAFDGINVTADEKEYEIKSSGNSPSVNELTAGVMPMGNGNEVVVPNSFVRNMGITDEQALGKTIVFNASIYNWSSGEPVLMPVNTTAKIVGVVDSTVKYDSGDDVMEYSVDDSFFFSKPALDDMLRQAKDEDKSASFSIRTKTPADLIAVKDELNANGIVPLGRFELVEDMVRLNDQTSQQSGAAVIIVGILSVVVALAVPIMTAFSRRREYAIYNVCGFSKEYITKLIIAETLFLALFSSLLFLIASPLLNLATAALWSVNILNAKMLVIGVLLTLCVSICAGAVTTIIGTSTNPQKALTTGEK